ncbi:hypothetical protein EDB81DRAFT_343712 [Dactylonectria macrodidyma]|uniref:Uncharacterized protein n=1 Tax=Dactylonectria macrodidyma TaxID=307937 RepID=A0A9P9JDF1_9HYPO|nr:hypothetical protein EDB81DRAFT_343712 [Dactylonectria macrodidyma]
MSRNATHQCTLRRTPPQTRPKSKPAATGAQLSFGAASHTVLRSLFPSSPIPPTPLFFAPRPLDPSSVAVCRVVVPLSPIACPPGPRTKDPDFSSSASLPALQPSTRRQRQRLLTTATYCRLTCLTCLLDCSSLAQASHLLAYSPSRLPRLPTSPARPLLLARCHCAASHHPSAPLWLLTPRIASHRLRFCAPRPISAIRRLLSAL